MGRSWPDGAGWKQLAVTTRRLLKVQTPALRLRRLRGGPDIWFGAHNFVAVVDAAGTVMAELHGIARGPDGAQLQIYGGGLPFRREVIWGEKFDHQTGFYDPSFPQAELFRGDDPAIDRYLGRADDVRRAVNARQIAYPWPAVFGPNSNAYFATLLAGMDLLDVRVDGQLWAPSGKRLILGDEVLEQIRSGSDARR